MLPPPPCQDLANDNIPLIVTQILSYVDEPVKKKNSDLKISKYIFFKSNHIAKNRFSIVILSAVLQCFFFSFEVLQIAINYSYLKKNGIKKKHTV